MQNLDNFSRQKYLNLETFRRSGAGVKTPVWFVQDGENFYVKTFSNSGKVKRIRNYQQVKIVPSKVDGKPNGTWRTGFGSIVKDASLEKKVEQLFDKKYGLLKKLFFRSRPGKVVEYCLLELKPVEYEVL
jgi:hypothetical protein